MAISAEQITAGILSGGEGRRLDGADKGWYPVAGRPLIEHTIERVRPQVGRIVISANRSFGRYQSLGYRVQGDDTDDYRGPLAGIATVLTEATTPYVLVVPVDTPLLPLDLAARLSAAMRPATDLVIARAAGELHPLHALIRRSLLDNVQAALLSGMRRVTEWQHSLRSVMVDWEDRKGFANVNSERDARLLADRL